MAVVVRLVRRGVTEARYGQARERVGWEREPPAGGLSHVAWFDAEGLHIVNVREGAEGFRRFAEGRPMPVVRGGLAFAGEPEVVLHEAHAVFIPTPARGRGHSSPWRGFPGNVHGRGPCRGGGATGPDQGRAGG